MNTVTGSPPQRSSDSVALLSLLERKRASIVHGAAESIRGGRSRYEAAGREEILRRIEILYDELLAALSRRDLSSIIDYARQLAVERFESGYDLSEVQAAFNAVEEATWSCICARLEPQHLALSLGLVSTALGAAKDALAREYVSRASRQHAPTLDIRALFGGGAGA